MYFNNPKYWYRQAFANSVYPDQTLQNEYPQHILQKYVVGTH